MDFLLKNLADIILLYMENLIPTKKSKLYKKNLKILKQQDWFNELRNGYNPVFLMNISIREKIIEYDEKLNQQEYKSELKEVLWKELG
jgi:hypothetical protein